MAAFPDYANVRVDKWQVSVETAPAQRDMPPQRIKLEIANIPAYTSELLPLRQNYDFLSGYGTVLVNAESVDEILADKVVAFSASVKNIRYRDIWDIAWLQQQGAGLNPELVLRKVEDYHMSGFDRLLADANRRLPGLIDSKEFADQMARFIDSETFNRTWHEPKFGEYLKGTVGQVLTAMTKHLGQAGSEAGPEFKM